MSVEELILEMSQDSTRISVTQFYLQLDLKQQEDMKVAMLVFTKCARRIIRIFWKN